MKILPAQFEIFQRFMFEQSGLVLEQGKEYLIEARLTPLLSELKFNDITELLEQLQHSGSKELQTSVVHALTTHETFFFRDETPFQTLREEIFPELVRNRQSTRRIRIWCGACSTGQEPYSIAITWLEHFSAYRSWDFQIVGTDISEPVVLQAREGIFSSLEAQRGLTIDMRNKYFTADGDRWRVIPEARRLIEFKQHNLLHSFSMFSDVDLIFLRNVLIYFNPEVKQDIFQRMRRVITDDGFLFLGTAETADMKSGLWKREIRGRSTVYRARKD